MIIGLTGGIGSGKSTIARLMEVLGGVVFNSDSAAREIYFDPLVKPQIVALLGTEAYLPGTGINTRYISSRIFKQTELLQALNAIIHPPVTYKFKAFAAANAGKLIVKESALIFEANLQHQVDKIITVAAEDHLRIQRVMGRDGSSREEVLQKMSSQLPQEEKIKRSDFVIDNSEKEFLIPQVLTIFNRLKADTNH